MQGTDTRSMQFVITTDIWEWIWPQENVEQYPLNPFKMSIASRKMYLLKKPKSQSENGIGNVAY
jgi:hypothetical protein